MKKIIIIILSIIVFNKVKAQYEEQIILPGRKSVNDLEHNLLFRAAERYNVTIEGNVNESMYEERLFDGAYAPNYNGSVTLDTPAIITITGLPAFSRTKGVYIGWVSRARNPMDFKIELLSENNEWIEFSSIHGYLDQTYMKKYNGGSAYGLRFTIYETNYTHDNKLGLAEFFMLATELTTPYEGLFLEQTIDSTEWWVKNTDTLKFADHVNVGTLHASNILLNGEELNTGNFVSPWSENSGDINFLTGNVGIGTDVPDSELTVRGTIHSQEVKVDLNGAVAPDYVFQEDYNLETLLETETYIKKNKHLPEIPSATEMEENGINLKELNLLLLKKIEELTLHQIEFLKRIEILEKRD